MNIKGWYAPICIMNNFQDVISAIESVGKKYYFNDTAKSIQTFKVPESNVAIVTSPRAIRDYDPYHPERIRCILLADQKQECYVVVKNRDVDIQSNFRFWMNKKPIKELCKSPDFNCKICFRKLMQPGKKIFFHTCFTCACTLCVKCLEKIQTSSTSHKCPVCQTWILSGEEYGLPHDQLDLSLPTDYPTLSLEKQLLTIFEKLDGLTNIIIRQDTDIYATEELSFCRLSYTNRYSKTYDTAAEVARSVTKITNTITLRHPKSLIRMYILRDTYKINKNESSAFKLKNHKLIQYAPDAWIDIFNYGQKVTYIEPIKPVLPEPYKGLYQELAKYSCEKTISVIHDYIERQKRIQKIVVNFDTDVNNAPTTLHIDTLTSSLSDSWERDPKNIYVTCRLFPYEEKTHADFIVFLWDSANTSAGFVKVDPKTCRQIFNQDIDELKKSKLIKQFF